MKSEKEHVIREIFETDICEWCQKDGSTITDGTYVYCSEKCKRRFHDNAMAAIRECYRNQIKHLVGKRDSCWYERNIEEGIRDEVRLLRDNGFNTECSCEHEKYVQCRYTTDGTIQELDELLFNNGFRNYIIEIRIKRDDGHIYPTMNIWFE